MFWTQMLMNTYLGFAAIYVSQLARAVVDENRFIEHPKSVIGEFLIIMILGMVASYLYQYCNQCYTNTLACTLKNQSAKRLLECNYASLENEHSGALMNRLSHDIQAVSEYLSGGFSEFISNMIRFLFCFGYLLFVNWQMLVTCSICIPITLFVTKKLANPTYETMERFETKMDEISAIAKDSVVNHKTEKVFGLKEIRRNYFNQVMDEATSHYVEYERLVAKASPVRYLLNSAPTLICILVGLICSYHGDITGGEFVSVILLLDYIAKPMSEFIGYITDYKMAQVSMDRIVEIIDAPVEPTGHESEGKVPETNQCIEMKEVCFGYAGTEHQVIKNMDWTVQKGDMVGIVGESGSGKSTLFKLILGLYTADLGAFLIYGKPLEEWNKVELRKQIAYVEQTPFLFEGTIFENIYAGNSKASKEDVVKAAMQAHAHEFIMELPNGYETYLTEGGKNLSGGQRQRLAIARAFVKDANILLLDEMTSALDAESERFIQQAIEAYRIAHKDRTICMIAHRLSTIQNADKIVVMEQGRIVQSGTHKELLEQEGTYRKLYLSGGEEI